jgi:hypothetical protein
MMTVLYNGEGFRLGNLSWSRCYLRKFPVGFDDLDVLSFTNGREKEITGKRIDSSISIILSV